MSTYIPKARKLLHLMSYFNRTNTVDSEFLDYKRRLGSMLRAHYFSMTTLPPVNIAAFCLDSLERAIYHQCVQDNRDLAERRLKTTVFDEFRDVVRRWKRILLGLDDAESYLVGVYDDFCRLCGYVHFDSSKSKLKNELENFICPLCIVSDIFTGIGWTEYLCPKTEGGVKDHLISSRGANPNLPAGGCEHVMTGCSFELYFGHAGIWGDTELDDPHCAVQDEWTLLFQRKADAHILRRLLFDTLKERRENQHYHTYNPYLTLNNDNDNLTALLFGPPPQVVHQSVDTSPSIKRCVNNLKGTLSKMMPYVTFLNRIHFDVMEDPATTTHQMFQKSVFYEVLFYYCVYNTNNDFLTTLILGCNDTYMGFDMASVDKMREKYTGQQYMAIVPRGLGKTRTIKLAVTVSLVTFTNVEILIMAHIKSLIGSTKDDIESCLANSFPPQKFGYLRKHHEDCLILEFNSGVINKLKYPSACRPASLRGNNPHIGFLDEALCVTQDSYTVINAMIQRKHTKIGFVSSPISSKKEILLDIVAGMFKKCSQINLYRVCFFCMKQIHVQYSAVYTGCYRKMFAPRYITYNQDNKAFESVITGTESSYENELGVIRPEDIANRETDMYDGKNHPAFSAEFICHLSDPTTFIKLRDLPVEEEVSYWIYVDPAFHPSGRSAIALSCVRYVKVKASQEHLVLCFLDRKLLNGGNIGSVVSILEEMYTRCVTTLVANTNGKCNFFVAIERNSSPDTVRKCYDLWVDLRKRRSGCPEARLLNANNCEFFSYVDVYKDRTLAYGYYLGSKKFHMCSTVINMFNTKHKHLFRIATTMEHGVFSKDICSLEYLKTEVMNYFYQDGRFSGKKGLGMTDDIVLCLISSSYLCIHHKGAANYRIRNLKEENIKNCTLPWIGQNCTCPLT
ncbi:hypothetical protein RRG08_061447 [Elysia crispata]|uniref:Probable DNA packing protein N-terminal domain-containing protein n=1 Tax=Elysia crispata TaxID=231223 RepID=A0AAE0YUB3_9GAST|nr:hypothetical protein RRG08_061447 [Elysia crispata]